MLNLLHLMKRPDLEIGPYRERLRRSGIDGIFYFYRCKRAPTIISKMLKWDKNEIQKCLGKVTVFIKWENHIIRSHPKNPKKGADLALRFKQTVVPEILNDVAQTVHSKITHGDTVTEDFVKTEIVSRINLELVKIGVAMIPVSGEYF